MSLEKAKTISLAVQDELVAFVPPELVAERITKQTSYLGRCKPREPIYQWIGRTRLTLTAPRDAKGIVDKIAQHYEAGATYFVDRTVIGGDDYVQLIGTDGSSYLIGNQAGGHTDIVITGNSPCFASDDVNLFDEY
jgi:hypothetical protein